MIQINLPQDPRSQFINLFNVSNDTIYKQDELKIISWRRDNEKTFVTIESSITDCEVKQAVVSFNHVPLEKLFERIKYSFLAKDFLVDSAFCSKKFFSKIKHTFDLFTASDLYDVEVTGSKITLKASETNLVYTGSAVFDLEIIIQLNPYILPTLKSSNYIKTYFHDFECFQFLDLDENNRFTRLDRLNDVLVNYYKIGAINSDMEIISRPPNAKLGDRTDCTKVVIVKQNDNKWDDYYFHFTDTRVL